MLRYTMNNSIVISHPTNRSKMASFCEEKIEFVVSRFLYLYTSCEVIAMISQQEILNELNELNEKRQFIRGIDFVFNE